MGWDLYKSCWCVCVLCMSLFRSEFVFHLFIYIYSLWFCACRFVLRDELMSGLTDEACFFVIGL